MASPAENSLFNSSSAEQDGTVDIKDAGCNNFRKILKPYRCALGVVLFLCAVFGLAFTILHFDITEKTENQITMANAPGQPTFVSASEVTFTEVEQIPPAELLLPRPFALTIDSPLTLLPMTQKEIYLTIDATTKQNWSQLDTKGAGFVTSLTLKGFFSYEDIIYFFKTFRNSKFLTFSWGTYLCDALEDSYDETQYERVRIISNITDLTISNVSQACKFLYKFLTEDVKFLHLEVLTLNNISIQYENREFIDELFRVNRHNLEKLHVKNATVLGNVDKALFDSVNLIKIEEGELQLNPSGSNLAFETFMNFSRATPNISKFKSNVYCVYSDWAKLRETWKLLIDSSKLCDM